MRHFFIPRSFDSIDLALPAVLGPATVCTYDVLRRHVCRTRRSRPGYGQLSRMFEAGQLVCSVSNPTIAKLVGVSTRSVIKHVAALKRIRWIVETGHCRRSGVKIYQLGHRETDAEAGTSEVFYADEWVEHARMVVEMGCAKRRINRLPIQERIELVETLLPDHRPT